VKCLFRTWTRQVKIYSLSNDQLIICHTKVPLWLFDRNWGLSQQLLLWYSGWVLFCFWFFSGLVSLVKCKPSSLLLWRHTDDVHWTVRPVAERSTLNHTQGPISFNFAMQSSTAAAKNTRAPWIIRSTCVREHRTLQQSEHWLNVRYRGLASVGRSTACSFTAAISDYTMLVHCGYALGFTICPPTTTLPHPQSSNPTFQLSRVGSMRSSEWQSHENLTNN